MKMHAIPLSYVMWQSPISPGNGFHKPTLKHMIFTILDGGCEMQMMSSLRGSLQSKALRTYSCNHSPKGCISMAKCARNALAISLFLTPCLSCLYCLLASSKWLWHASCSLDSKRGHKLLLNVNYHPQSQC